ASLGLRGGGFLYTNQSTISLGLVVSSEDLAREKVEIQEVQTRFRMHPAVQRWIRGGKVTEYSAHLVPELGAGMMPRLWGDGVLVAGDAAGFLINNGYTFRGVDLAIASGIAAGEAVEAARAAGGPRAANLQVYEKFLRSRNVLPDLERFRRAPLYMKNERLFDVYPRMLLEIAERLYTVDGSGKERLADIVLREAGAAEVVVLSMGPTSFDESLERAVAMGADRAVLLTDRLLGGSDTVPTAYALSETIQKIGGYDLILTGEETTDASTGHVGPGIAGHLDLPQTTYVSEVRIVDNTVRARRTAEDGTEWWQTNMPSLCTVNFGCNKPRSPTLTGKIRVKRGGVIAHWSCADVGIDPKKVGLLNSPTIVAKVDTIRLPPRAGHIFSGEPKETVRALLEALIRDRVIAP